MAKASVLAFAIALRYLCRKINPVVPLNTVDLIVCLVVALAVWNGWRRGFVIQACSLVGIAAGIWLAARFGAEVGAGLRLDPEVAAAGGFAAVFVAAVLVVAVAARAVRRIFRFAGLGTADVALGIGVSVVKYLLVLSVAFAAFDAFNADYGLVGASTIESSKTYRPVLRLSGALFPLVDRLRAGASGDEGGEKR